MWGRGFLCIFCRDADSPHWIPKRLMRHHGPMMPKVVDEINQGVKRMRIIQRLSPRSVKKAHNTHASPLPTWSQVKKLTTEGEDLLRHTSQPQTSEALLLAMVTILSCQVCGTSGETYWAYFPDSPIPHPAS
jgi:hypothetical protein